MRKILLHSCSGHFFFHNTSCCPHCEAGEPGEISFIAILWRRGLVFNMNITSMTSQKDADMLNTLSIKLQPLAS